MELPLYSRLTLGYRCSSIHGGECNKNELIRSLASIPHTCSPLAQRCPICMVAGRRCHNSAQPRGSASAGCQTQTSVYRTSSCAKFRLQTHDRGLDSWNHRSAGQKAPPFPKNVTKRDQKKNRIEGNGVAALVGLFGITT